MVLRIMMLVVGVTMFGWSVSDANAQSQILDESLTNPSNPIATDAGTWGPKSQLQTFFFLNQSGLWGNFYDDCFGYELYHPQHIVRLANKNGRAYFVVAQSRAHNGWISVLETDPGVLNPDTDELVSKGDGLPVGKYIWQDLYRWKDQIPNPVGNWNHPGKMDVVGGVLIVAAQNWAASKACSRGEKGKSVDKVLFYDVRDPQQPKYWGAIDAGKLGVKEISTVGLVKTPDGQYLLTAGGADSYSTWRAPKISPNLEDWVRVSNGTFGGQHGMMFNSYQKETSLTDSKLVKGTERLMYFDSSGRNQFNFADYSVSKEGVLSSGGNIAYPMPLPGANRDWDADSIYVSPKTGRTIVYTVKSAKGEHGNIYQVVNPD